MTAALGVTAALGMTTALGHIFGAFTGCSQDLLAAVPARCGSIPVMDTTHQPPAGDPQDFWVTQELGPVTGQPGQGPGWSQPPGAPGYQLPAAPGHLPPGPSGPPRRRGRAAWWGAGLALAAVLAGGAVAAAQLTGSASPVPPGPTGQAATLNTMLNSASSPGSAAEAASFGTTSPGTESAACASRAAKLKAAGFPGLARAVLRRCGHPLRRVRLLGGIHGQFTFETASGPRTLAYERGVIQLISGNDVVVQAKDGTSWTWALESSTVIRRDRQRVTASALSVGEQVFAGGTVVSSDYDARLIVIRPASPPSSPASPSPAPSPASGS
jgi:hypothetical protein